MRDNARIVIVGGGFGGLNAARALAKADAEVTLVDRSNHHLFQPLLYQVATATLSPADIAMPIRHILRKQKNTDVILGEVVGVDKDGRRVLLADGSTLSYDFLVLTTGATHSYFGHPEWEHIARGLKSIEDATYIRGEVLAAFEYAERTPDPKEQEEWMTFIIVGGGPTGAELAGAFAELARKVMDDEFRHIKPGMSKIILVEGADRIMSAFDPALSASAQRQLERLGVRVRLKTMVKSVDQHGVETDNGRIEGRTIIWAAGVQASPAAKWLGVEAAKSGRVEVNPDLTLPGHSEIYLIGDCAEATDKDGKPLPGLAPVAMQQGTYVGRRLTAIIRGEHPEKPFKYFDKGILAVIGRSRAIAQVGKIKLSGWIAWMTWLFVHIMYLVGFRNRISVLLQWAWAYITWDRGARLIAPSEWARYRPQDAPPESDGKGKPEISSRPAASSTRR